MPTYSVEEIFSDFSCSCLLPCGHRGARRGLSALAVPLPPPCALPLPCSSHGLVPASALPVPAGSRHPPRRAHPEVLVAVLADLAVRVTVEPAERGVQQPRHRARPGPAAGILPEPPRTGRGERRATDAAPPPRAIGRAGCHSGREAGPHRRAANRRRGGPPAALGRSAQAQCGGAGSVAPRPSRSFPEGPWRGRGWRPLKVPRVAGSPFSMSAVTGG